MPDDDWLFPVGHFLGPFYPRDGAGPPHYRLRVGASVVRLTSEREMAVWALTHGLPERPETGPWTRGALLAAAQESGEAGEGGDADLAAVLDALLAAGAVVRVPADGSGAAGFARRYRLRSLLLGTGWDPAHPDQYGIGLLARPAVGVGLFTFEVWQWAHLHDSLWRAAESFADAAGAGPGAPEPYATGAGTAATELVGALLPEVQALVAIGAAYLEPAEGGGPES